jgi:hypothetical protein
MISQPSPSKTPPIFDSKIHPKLEKSPNDASPVLPDSGPPSPSVKLEPGLTSVNVVPEPDPFDDALYESDEVDELEFDFELNYDSVYNFVSLPLPVKHEPKVEIPATKVVRSLPSSPSVELPKVKLGHGKEVRRFSTPYSGMVLRGRVHKTVEDPADPIEHSSDPFVDPIKTVPSRSRPYLKAGKRHARKHKLVKLKLENDEPFQDQFMK